MNEIRYLRNFGVELGRAQCLQGLPPAQGAMRAACGVDLRYALEELGGVLACWSACWSACCGHVQRSACGGHPLGLERRAEQAP